ncbi:MarR family transcriptional regulator [Pediococcus argentinicus]|uniref:MarR family winged helix-turn-helix transcriptional regulator n=1 Tax=Pediococcus argentinicus TaxID=480391 RepID=UPI00338E05A6
MTLSKPNEVDALVSNLNIVARRAQMKLDEALRPLGLTSSNYYFVLKINGSKELSQEQLMKNLFLNQSNITRRLDQLIAKGLVQKEHSPKDGRTWIITLTSAGQEIVTELTKIIEDYNEQLFTNLDVSQSELLNIFEQLNDNLER